jgi:signal transduction histidine kinase
MVVRFRQVHRGRVRDLGDDFLQLLEANDPGVECLIFQLNQAFMNLFVNAAQAIGTHGTITLRTGADGERVAAPRSAQHVEVKHTMVRRNR